MIIKLAHYFDKKHKSHIGKGALVGGMLGGTAALGTSALLTGVALDQMSHTNVTLTPRGLLAALAIPTIAGGLMGAGAGSAIGSLIRTKKEKS